MAREPFAGMRADALKWFSGNGLSVNKEKTEEFVFSLKRTEISSNQDRTYEVREPANKACRVASALRDVIFNNKYMSKHSKTRIYKTCVRPIMTYAIETRADNKRTKSILRTTEMKILITISGYTLRDRKRNTAILEECQIQDIVKWGKARRRYWNNHVSRMNTGRIAKIARDGIPNTRRPIGRPPKR
ncbi:uncharacterized protein LOC123313947 [Coccinella septempunctata]|uniref:uncharacterized protein LOC123313947 n=1 Tax=Coccinella septempunctata TaxID=41139 RepID=UPI001D064F84|nr:uncharacterized protein LOC123313947 [Coccinella septempunctata]